MADLRQGRIRVIGDAGERFREDPVRIWRVIRYAARLGFRDRRGGRERDTRIPGTCWPAVRKPACSRSSPRTCWARKRGPSSSGMREFGILSLLLGRIGAAFESDPRLFAKACALLDIADGEKALRRDPGLGEMSVLLFWPWVESLLAGAPPDPGTILRKEFMDADLAVALPKSLRAQAIDVMVLVNRMMRALRTGNMRWSMRGRPQYPQASRLCFLIEQHRVPEEGESFESLFQKAFPDAPAPGRRRHGGAGAGKDPPFSEPRCRAARAFSAMLLLESGQFGRLARRFQKFLGQGEYFLFSLQQARQKTGAFAVVQAGDIEVGAAVAFRIGAGQLFQTLRFHEQGGLFALPQGSGSGAGFDPERDGDGEQRFAQHDPKRGRGIFRPGLAAANDHGGRGDVAVDGVAAGDPEGLFAGNGFELRIGGLRAPGHARCRG